MEITELKPTYVFMATVVQQLLNKLKKQGRRGMSRPDCFSYMSSIAPGIVADGQLRVTKGKRKGQLLSAHVGPTLTLATDAGIVKNVNDKVLFKDNWSLFDIARAIREAHLNRTHMSNKRRKKQTSLHRKPKLTSSQKQSKKTFGSKEMVVMVNGFEVRGSAEDIRAIVCGNGQMGDKYA